jgi:hypothetical protein
LNTPRATQPSALLALKPWLALIAGAVVLTAITAATSGAELAVGVAFFFASLLLPFRFPLEAAYLVLLTSWLPIENLTEKERNLFGGLGGLNASGMRLIGGILGLLIALWVLRDKLRQITLPPWFRMALIAYVAFVAWAALSVLWSPAFVDGARAVAKFAFPVLVAAVIVADPRDMGPRRLIQTTALVFAGSLILATLYGFLGVADRSLLPTVETGWVARDYGWAGWSDFGFFAGITAVLLWATILSGVRPPLLGKVWRDRLLVAGVIVLALVQIPLALKRISVGAAGVGIAALILRAGPRRWLAPIGVIAAAAALLFFGPLVERNVYVPNASEAQPTVAKRDSSSSQSIGAIKDLAHGGKIDHVIRFEGRNDLWRVALDSMHGKDYLIGNGSNAWASSNFGESGSGQLHGEPIRVAYEFGGVGVLLIGIAFGTMFAAFVRQALKSRRGTASRALGGAAGATLLLDLITTLTDNTLDYYLIGACAWSVFAMAALAYRLDGETDDDDEAPARENGRFLRKDTQAQRATARA